MVIHRHIVAVVAALSVAACTTDPTDREQQLAAQNEETVWPKIINGEKVPDGKAPWQVALVRTDRSNTLWAQFCGGVLIDSDTVLTAAHCFRNYSDPRRQAAVFVNSQTLSSTGRRVAIAQYIPHHRFNPSNKDYDFAILRLAEPVIPAGQAIKLPTADAEAHLDNGSDLVTFGWGYTRIGGSKSYELLQVELDYVSNDICNMKQSYNGAITARMLCARSEAGGDACQGDSGGPLLDAHSKVLLGIVSGGQGCAQLYKYGIYARVTAVLPWIDETLRHKP